ncbi:hypothetical protein Tco_1097635 [Tanacetum coccineum]
MEPVNSQHGIKAQGIKQHSKSYSSIIQESNLRFLLKGTQPWMLFEEDVEFEEEESRKEQRCVARRNLPRSHYGNQDQVTGRTLDIEDIKL